MPATEYVDLWERTPDDAIVYVIWDDNRLNGLGSSATPCQKQDRVLAINNEFIDFKKKKKHATNNEQGKDESGDEDGDETKDQGEDEGDDATGKKRNLAGIQKEFDDWLVDKKYKPHLFSTVAEFRFCRALANSFQEFGDIDGGWPAFSNLR